jgi:hypothetical protein
MKPSTQGLTSLSQIPVRLMQQPCLSDPDGSQAKSFTGLDIDHCSVVLSEHGRLFFYTGRAGTGQRQAGKEGSADRGVYDCTRALGLCILMLMLAGTGLRLI